MIKKLAAAAAIAATSLSFIAVAQAEDFPAAPMNPGPAKVTGMGPIGDLANVALIPTNVIMQPIMAPMATAEPAPAPMVMHHHHHHHMMKKAM